MTVLMRSGVWCEREEAGEGGEVVCNTEKNQGLHRAHQRENDTRAREGRRGENTESVGRQWWRA